MTTMSQGLAPIRDPYNVYDDMERVRKEVASLRRKVENQKNAIEIWREMFEAEVDKNFDLSETVGRYQQHDINLRFQNEHLRDYADALKRRSFWQRLRNIDPTF